MPSSAATARSRSASSTSLWVTNRTVSASMVPAQHAVAPRARRAGRPGARSARAHTMLVSTVAGSTLPGNALGERVGEAPGAGVVVGAGARPSSRARRSPAAAITPPGASRRRGAAGRARASAISVARCRTAASRPARPAPSTGRTSRCRRRATSSAGDDAERDRRVPDARAVAVHREPVRRARPPIDRVELGGAPRAARTPACACSRANSAEIVGQVVLLRRRRARDRRRRSQQCRRRRAAGAAARRAFTAAAACS